MKKDFVDFIIFIIDTSKITIFYIVISFLFLSVMYKYNTSASNIKPLIENSEKEDLPTIKIVRKVIEKPKLKVVFNEYNLSEVSNVTYEEMDKLLSDTTMSHLSKAIVDSEKTYGVNSFLTLSIIALESSWATSTRVIESNNLSGMAVYGDDSPGEYYNTQYECVMDTAKQLKKHYLSSDGIYYNGLSTKEVNIKYSSNKNWYNIVNEIAYEMIHKYDKLFKGE